MRLFALILWASLSYGQVIDHTCTDYTPIPQQWLDSARAKLRIGYANTSHGHQLISGMYVMRDYLPGFSAELWVNGLTPGKFINYVWAYPAYEYSGLPVNDLQYGDGAFTWATRWMLNGGDGVNDRNVVMWAWCWHLRDATASQVSKYLTGMDSLEREYPNIKFVYMTGCLAGTGVSGNLNQRNEQIRSYCKANGKILYDFADIESYDPDGSVNFMELGANDNCDYSGGNWASQWIASHPASKLTQMASVCTDCDHSQGLNCILKASAAWYLFARLAGWQSETPVEPEPIVRRPWMRN